MHSGLHLHVCSVHSASRGIGPKGYRQVDLFALGLAVLVLTAGLVLLPLFELVVDLALLPLLALLVLPFVCSRRSFSSCILLSDCAWLSGSHFILVVS